MNETRDLKISLKEFDEYEIRRQQIISEMDVLYSKLGSFEPKEDMYENIDAIKVYRSEQNKIMRKLNRLSSEFDEIMDAQVELTLERDRFIAEINQYNIQARDLRREEMEMKFLLKKAENMASTPSSIEMIKILNERIEALNNAIIDLEKTKPTAESIILADKVFRDIEKAKEPVVIEPVQIEPVSVETTAPIEPDPIEPVSVEPTPIEPAPIEPSPILNPVNSEQPIAPVQSNEEIDPFMRRRSNPVQSPITPNPTPINNSQPPVQTAPVETGSEGVYTSDASDLDGFNPANVAFFANSDGDDEELSDAEIDNIDRSVRTPEPDQPVINNREATPEEKEKYKVSKKKMVNRIIAGLAISTGVILALASAGTLAVGGAVAIPMGIFTGVPIVGAAALAYTIRKKKWTPKNKFEEFICNNVNKVLDKVSDPKSKDGGKAK